MKSAVKKKIVYEWLRSIDRSNYLLYKSASVTGSVQINTRHICQLIRHTHKATSNRKLYSHYIGTDLRTITGANAAALLIRSRYSPLALPSAVMLPVITARPGPGMWVCLCIVFAFSGMLGKHALSYQNGTGWRMAPPPPDRRDGGEWTPHGQKAVLIGKEWSVTCSSPPRWKSTNEWLNVPRLDKPFYVAMNVC